MIYRAPGKVVFWGEYAVLDGAPAAVMAINRFAEVEITKRDTGWHFHSEGFLTPGVHKRQPDFSHAPSAALAETILKHWGYTSFTEAFALISNSADFFHIEPRTPRQKLGIGSSAAVCTATYYALAELLDRTPDLAEAMDIHREFQGGKGSGLDVAASWTGGFIRFSDSHTDTLNWPNQLHWQVVWTGKSASTPAALNSFSEWREQADTHTLTELGAISRTLSEHISLTNLARYIKCLRALDRAAALNIFTQDHERLATIASDKGLLYKPCGAGGGDIGLACGEDPQALVDFCSAAVRDNYIPLALETAPHGVKAG